MTAVPHADELPANAPLFTVPVALVKILDRDLKLAGIAKRDDLGRAVDVHALRHCFGTLLSQNGVAPRIAQAAMRHSTIDLTMNVYTDPRLLDVHQAVESLPDLRLDRPTLDRQRATGTLSAPTRGDFPFAPAFALTNDNWSKSQATTVNSAGGDEAPSLPSRVCNRARFLDENGPLPLHDSGPFLVERKGVEPSTFALRTRRSPN